MNQTSKNALHDPKYWRNLAREARREADQLNDARSKQTILEVAHAYERLADRKEKAARRLSRAAKLP